jgi:hypothetical protein
VIKTQRTLLFSFYLRLEPLGLELVAQAVRQAGHEVRILDLQTETPNDYFKVIDSWKTIRQKHLLKGCGRPALTFPCRRGLYARVQFQMEDLSGDRGHKARAYMSDDFAIIATALVDSRQALQSRISTL